MLQLERKAATRAVDAGRVPLAPAIGSGVLGWSSGGGRRRRNVGPRLRDPARRGRLRWGRDWLDLRRLFRRHQLAQFDLQHPGRGRSGELFPGQKRYCEQQENVEPQGSSERDSPSLSAALQSSPWSPKCNHGATERPPTLCARVSGRVRRARPALRIQIIAIDPRAERSPSETVNRVGLPSLDGKVAARSIAASFPEGSA